MISSGNLAFWSVLACGRVFRYGIFGGTTDLNRLKFHTGREGYVSKESLCYRGRDTERA